MSENILIAIAWPYANAEIHVGNITGSHLPGISLPDIIDLKGNKVLMVSGTIRMEHRSLLRADALNKTPEDVYKEYHNGFIELFQQLGYLMIYSPLPTQLITSKFPRAFFWH